VEDITSLDITSSALKTKQRIRALKVLHVR